MAIPSREITLALNIYFPFQAGSFFWGGGGGGGGGKDAWLLLKESICSPCLGSIPFPILKGLNTMEATSHPSANCIFFCKMAAKYHDVPIQV